jgi:hypothetical protein
MNLMRGLLQACDLRMKSLPTIDIDICTKNAMALAQKKRQLGLHDAAAQFYWRGTDTIERANDVFSAHQHRAGRYWPVPVWPETTHLHCQSRVNSRDPGGVVWSSGKFLKSRRSCPRRPWRWRRMGVWPWGAGPGWVSSGSRIHRQILYGRPAAWFFLSAASLFASNPGLPFGLAREFVVRVSGDSISSHASTDQHDPGDTELQTHAGSVPQFGPWSADWFGNHGRSALARLAIWSFFPLRLSLGFCSCG